jgi:hypothetical protein
MKALPNPNPSPDLVFDTSDNIVGGSLAGTPGYLYGSG